MPAVVVAQGAMGPVAVVVLLIEAGLLAVPALPLLVQAVRKYSKRSSTDRCRIWVVIC